MDIEFPSFAALQDEVARRRDGGSVLLYAADPKARRVGFVAGEDTLFVRMSLLTRAQLDQVVRGEEVLLHPEGLETPSTESDPPLDGLWGDGLDHDGVEIANILIEGEKAVIM